MFWESYDNEVLNPSWLRDFLKIRDKFLKYISFLYSRNDTYEASYLVNNFMFNYISEIVDVHLGWGKDTVRAIFLDFKKYEHSQDIQIDEKLSQLVKDSLELFWKKYERDILSPDWVRELSDTRDRFIKDIIYQDKKKTYSTEYANQHLNTFFRMLCNLCITDKLDEVEPFFFDFEDSEFSDLMEENTELSRLVKDSLHTLWEKYKKEWPSVKTKVLQEKQRSEKFDKQAEEARSDSIISIFEGLEYTPHNNAKGPFPSALSKAKF